MASTAGDGAVGGDGSVAGDGASSGDAASVIEYRGCFSFGAVSFFSLFRIDRTSAVCTIVWIEENFGLCQPLDIVSGGWCLSTAWVSNNVTSCKAMGIPGDRVAALAATGTFTVSGLVVDIDVDLQFPSGGALPETVAFRATGCDASCAAGDCRP